MASLLLRFGPTVALVVALACAGWWLRDVVAERDQLKNAVAVRDAQLREAARIRMIDREYRAEVEAERQEWEQLRRELRDMEGGNEPLGDYLGALAKRLWPE